MQNIQSKKMDSNMIREMFLDILREDSGYLDDILALNSPIDMGTVHKEDYQTPQHIRLINKKLMELEAGTFNRLGIFAPPGHSKSLTVAYFIAWYLIRHPDHRVIYSTYGQDLSNIQSGIVKQIIADIGPLFGVYLDPKSNSKDYWKLKGKKGYFKAVGVNGPISGMRAELAILDDPLKNMQTALSTTEQEKTWDWYTSTFLTRLVPDGRHVLIQTIWSTDDIGYKIREGAFNEPDNPWEIINLPVYAEQNDIIGREPGELLWPEYWTEESIQQRRSEVGEWVFNALFMQNPTMKGGNLFQNEWLKEYDSYMTHFNEGLYTTYMGVDPAATVKESSDDTCICVLKVHRDTGDIYIVDWTMDKLTPVEQRDLVIQKYQYWSPSLVGIETIAYQTALVSMINEKIAMPIKEMKPGMKKEERIRNTFTLFEQGKVYIPKNHGVLGEWKSQYLQFPNAKHDDLLDSTEIALSLIQGGSHISMVGDESYTYGADARNKRRGNSRGDTRTAPGYKNNKRRR